MPLPRYPFLVFLLFLIVIGSAIGGFQAGNEADTETELNQSIDEIETNFSEVKEDNMSVDYSDYEGGDTGLGEKVDRAVLRVMVEPIYWFTRLMLDVSLAVFEGSARIAYRYL